ncbi:hypothetical protein QYE76_009096 [Lolium multiflorum]|uniref:Uncharacterized protein n=1 Tax=Lolium multiflorum TaxID=4521 RepID=A0AAD8TU83_LOLMU|nr:hypothetical protein QYE76_009096 [Lolium multiflorum]
MGVSCWKEAEQRLQRGSAGDGRRRPGQLVAAESPGGRVRACLSGTLGHHTARTSTSHTLVASETPVEGEETSPPRQNVGAATPPSSPLVPSPKRARVETNPELTLQSSSSSNPLLDDPMIKELLRIGAQFVGYRDYASKTEEKLAEANERADALAQKLEQCEEARKKAESDAVEARQEADKAKADAAGVEDLRKRLHDAETSLSEHITAQSAREAAITKRIRTQNRRFVSKYLRHFISFGFFFFALVC